MSPGFKKLAAHLLRWASDEFSNHGCNDFDMPAFVSDEEVEALVRTSCKDAGDEEWLEKRLQALHISRNRHNLQDWYVMVVMADMLEAEAQEDPCPPTT